MTRQHFVLLIIGLAVIVVWQKQRYESDFTSTPPSSKPGRSIGEYKPPFHEEWRRKHNAFPFECWHEAGYDPSRSTIPRNVQLLSGMDYGKSDIDNGGFHQFFYNSTGVFAPEMVEWCERSGLEDVARVIREAMSTLSDGEYPRSRADRHDALARFPVRSNREGLDPFYKLDEKFYALLSNNGSRYDDAADKWLRDTCGINKLSDTPKAE